MNKNSIFFKQAEIMLKLIPSVANEKCFALKGGTAINFFVRDMPRLSVDIDLTYLPLEPREKSLQEIGAALTRAAASMRKSFPKLQIQEKRVGADVAKLIFDPANHYIKIEPNQIIRGTNTRARERTLVPKAVETFSQEVSIQVVSTADLYGGKICAALDRQHPRDLFDVKLLLENEGITDAVRKSFLIYLISHDRAINELIEPTRKDISAIYQTEFADMPLEPVTLLELIETRETLINTLMKDLTDQERRFLVSFKSNEPDWALLGVPGVERLPAVQWKLMNIGKMPKAKHAEQLVRLIEKLHV